MLYMWSESGDGRRAETDEEPQMTYTCPNCKHIGDDSERGTSPAIYGECCAPCFAAFSTLVEAGAAFSVTSGRWLLDVTAVDFATDELDAAFNVVGAGETWCVGDDRLTHHGWHLDTIRGALVTDDDELRDVCEDIGWEWEPEDNGVYRYEEVPGEYEWRTSRGV